MGWSFLVGLVLGICVPLLCNCVTHLLLGEVFLSVLYLRESISDFLDCIGGLTVIGNFGNWFLFQLTYANTFIKDIDTYIFKYIYLHMLYCI